MSHLASLLRWVRRTSPPVVATFLATLAVPTSAVGQTGTASISESREVITTYPYAEANPVPILHRDPRLYPYHSFHAYSTTSEDQEWTVVRLENDLIEVFVLPEVGGKVWGARVKETGHEFIYRNEVLKFRNIALRGPWTSGGIEFNFGVIGHTPATATPVDYILQENPDGSVSCWIGGTDLPSRTRWRVEIRLQPDRAAFETHVSWHNPTTLRQPFYAWMTGAAFARDDLVLTIPGNRYLEHGGAVHPWPRDTQGRVLSRYAENDFGSHKSYHVVGELSDFFGGYYDQADWGFGHWARHEDLPGRKLWLWSLAREGGVWEDLLTDTDGQYVEFQAGPLLVQYAPDSEQDPVRQAGIDPISTSGWSESWFPLEGLGGLTEASQHGALFVNTIDNKLTVAVTAFEAKESVLEVLVEDTLVWSEAMDLDPLEVTRIELPEPHGEFSVRAKELGLRFNSGSADTLSRPFDLAPGTVASLTEADRLDREAEELHLGRYFAAARLKYDSVLALEPFRRNALLGKADLALRAGDPALGLEAVRKALQLNTYDPDANFIAGVLHRENGAYSDAYDAFSWAARSMQYRASAYTQMAEIALLTEEPAEAMRLARTALNWDRSNPNAWEIIAVLARDLGDHGAVTDARGVLLRTDPLHPVSHAETFLDDLQSPSEFLGKLRGEYPEQTLLELTIRYASLGREKEAARLAATGADLANATVLSAWYAYLTDRVDLLPQEVDLTLVFPYRPETVPVLEWASAHTSRWEWTYLLGLNLWALGHDIDALSRWTDLADTPDWGPFYAARASLTQDPTRRKEDLARARERSPDLRVLHVSEIDQALSSEDWARATHLATEALERFQGDFELELLLSSALIESGEAAKAVGILESTHVLPSEHARTSHDRFETAHLVLAVEAVEEERWQAARTHLATARTWPENLGQGQPFEPHTPLIDALEAVAALRGGDDERAKKLLEVTALNQGTSSESELLSLVAHQALTQLGTGLDGLHRNVTTTPASLLHHSLGQGHSLAASIRDLAAEDPAVFSSARGNVLHRTLSLLASSLEAPSR